MRCRVWLTCCLSLLNALTHRLLYETLIGLAAGFTNARNRPQPSQCLKSRKEAKKSSEVRITATVVDVSEKTLETRELHWAMDKKASLQTFMEDKQCYGVAT